MDLFELTRNIQKYSIIVNYLLFLRVCRKSNNTKQDKSYHQKGKTDILPQNKWDKFKNKKLLSVRKYIVKRDLNWLKNSDLFIAEVSVYSHGIGYEHRCAEEFKKPILMLRHSSLSKKTYSAFLDGSGYAKFSFSFYDSGNIKKILKRFIKKYER